MLQTKSISWCRKKCASTPHYCHLNSIPWRSQIFLYSVLAVFSLLSFSCSSSEGIKTSKSKVENQLKATHIVTVLALFVSLYLFWIVLQDGVSLFFQVLACDYQHRSLTPEHWFVNIFLNFLLDETSII